MYAHRDEADKMYATLNHIDPDIAARPSSRPSPTSSSIGGRSRQINASSTSYTVCASKRELIKRK